MRTFFFLIFGAVAVAACESEVEPRQEGERNGSSRHSDIPQHECDYKRDISSLQSIHASPAGVLFLGGNQAAYRFVEGESPEPIAGSLPALPEPGAGG